MQQPPVFHPPPSQLQNGQPMQLPPMMPHLPLIPPSTGPGLQALYTACRAVYPNQHNPLQVAAMTKFWMGGPDPLDFISMYSNPGDPSNGIPPHWHYISFGLSDLYGDGRLYEINGSGSPSGFGFELTFRLKKESDESSPPTWPAAVMQSLARYVFNSDNTLCPGDHVSWHCPLDSPTSDSRIQHMLMSEDPQLGTVMTPFGSVTFVQIVGVCQEELQAAQQWNGPGLIDMMKSVPGIGGSWLITDMRRGETIFDINPSIRENVDDAINAEGSNLSGVTANCSWSQKAVESQEKDDEEQEVNGNHSKHSTSVSSTRNQPIVSAIGHQDVDHENRSTLSPTSPSRMGSRTSRQSAMSVQETQSVAAAIEEVREPAELLRTRYLESIHIKLNLEAGNLLPLVFRGRLKHDRHFTFKTVSGDLAITLLTENVAGSHVSLETPYAIHGPWLQVLIPRASVEDILSELTDVLPIDPENLPKTLFWNDQKLSVTILPDSPVVSTQ